MTWRLEQAEGALPEAWRGPVGDLFTLCLGEGHDALFAQTVLGAPTLSLSAWADEQLVGFKIGSVRKVGQFHSAAGGVHPDWRRQGIARALARAQQAWCREQGLSAVTTHTLADNVPMLIFNLHDGFRIVGVTTGRDGVLKVQFEKPLG